MKLLILVLGLALLIPACGSALRSEYDRGAVTPFARNVLGESSKPAPAISTETDRGLDEAEEHLESLATRWKSRVREKPYDAETLGFDLAEVPDREALRGPLTPGLVLAAAAAMSPAIEADRAKLRATVEQFDQVAFLDAILRQYSSFTRDLNLRIGAPLQKSTIERDFPFPGSLALKTRIVEADAVAAEERLARTVRTTLAATGTAYYEYAYVHEAIRIVEENVDLLGGIVEIARSKYGVGRAQQAVVLKAHVEIASLQNRLVTLKERLNTVRARMSSLLGLPASFPLGAPGTHGGTTPPGESESLYALGRKHRQEVVALSAKIRRTEALIELAETKAYPDLSLGYSRFEDGTATRVGGARMAEPFATKPRSMPKFWFGETASFIHEMRSRLEGMRAALADLETRVEFEVKDAWFKWDAASREVRLHEGSMLPQAEQAYRVLESGFQEGITDFLDALDAQRTWLRLRLEYREAVMATNRGRFALLNALGTRIPAGDGEDR